MPKQNRIKTTYPGVFYIEGTSTTNAKVERIFYISYWKNGKKIEEKAGRQFQDNMTAAKAAQIRARRVMKDELPNNERRQLEEARKKAQDSRWTIKRLWDGYQEGLPEGKSKSTDAGRFVNHLEAPFGDKTPAELIALDVRKLRTTLSKTHSAQTVAHILGLLIRIVNYGVNHELCNPLTFKITKPDVDNEKTEDLTDEQFQRLWDAIEADHDTQAKNLMKLVLYTGMRRGELFKLKWEDCNFERNFILIRDPKGGKSQKIPMNDAARHLLLTHERPFPNSAYVFPGRYGGQRTDIKRAVHRIADRAQLPKGFRPLHGLRHVFASMLASSGKIDLYTLQKMLTHKSPKMTQRYAHLRDEALQRASQTTLDVIQETLQSRREQERKRA